MFVFLVVIVLLILFVGVFLFFNNCYKRTNYYKNQHHEIQHMLSLSKSDKFDIVNVGSSQQLFGFDYSDINDLKCDNWAEYPQFFEFDYALLRQYKKHIKKGAVVIIPVNACVFFVGRRLFVNAAIRYYPIICSKYLPHCDMKRYLREHYPLLYNPKNIRWIFRDTDFLRNGYEIERHRCITDEDYTTDAKGYISRWDSGFRIRIPSLNINDEQSRNIEKNVAILQDIIAYCRKNDWQPVICLLPSTKHLTSLFTDEFISKMVLENVKRAAQDIPFLNYWDDERYMDKKWFMSSFFMNEKGRKAMTRVIIDDIKKLGIIQ